MKMAGSNLPSSRMDTTKRPNGTSLAMVTMVLMPAASLTPRLTRYVSTQRKMDAQTHETMLLPSPNTGKK